MDDLAVWPPGGLRRKHYIPFAKHEDMSAVAKAKLLEFFDSMLIQAQN